MPLILVALLLAFGTMLLFGGTQFDQGLLTLAHLGRQSVYLPYVQWLSEAGGYRVLLPATAIGAVVLLVRRDWQGALLLVGVTGSGRLLVEAIKTWTARVRPDPAGQLVATENLSFPSAHAANATMVWLCLALLLTRHAPARPLAIWAAVWLALAVGISRPLLGVHWPTDVIAGWAFGLFWTLLLLGLAGRATDDGTPRAVPAFLPKRRPEMDRNDRSTDRAETARQTDDSDLIENMEDAPSHANRSGHRIGQDIGSQDELKQAVGEGGVTRAHGGDKGDEPNLPRFNQS